MVARVLRVVYIASWVTAKSLVIKLLRYMQECSGWLLGCCYEVIKVIREADTVLPCMSYGVPAGCYALAIWL